MTRRRAIGFALSTGKPLYTGETCVQCRLRKVRCDGEQDVCSNCKRLEFACSFSAHKHASRSSTDGTILEEFVSKPPRRRNAVACRACKAHKVRCSGTRPPCTRCRQRNSTCVYPSTASYQRNDTDRRNLIREQAALESSLPLDDGNGASRGTGAVRELDDAIVVVPDTPTRVTTTSDEPLLQTPLQSSSPTDSRFVPFAIDTTAVTAGISPRRGHNPPSPTSAPSPTPQQSSHRPDSVDLTRECCQCLDQLQIRIPQYHPLGHEFLPTPPPSRAVPHRSSPITDALVDVFFRQIYPLPSYSFLHPPSTKAKSGAGTLDPCLLLSLVGVSTLHMSMRSNSEAGSKSRTWSPEVCEGDDHHLRQHFRACRCTGLLPIRAAEQIIWSNIGDPTVPRLQALLLSINYSMHTGQFQRAFMLASLASRFTMALKLNHEQPSLDAVARETRRRILWSLKLTERYFSIGLPEFELCHFESIYVKLPSLEVEYVESHTHQQLSPAAGPHGEDDYGCYRLCVQLESVRRDIVKLCRQISVCDASSAAHISSLMDSLANRLDDIGTKLPHGPNMSFGQVSSLLHSKWLPRHVALQLSWHQCHCDLYRLLLPGYPESVPQPIFRQVLRSRENDSSDRHGSKQDTSGILLQAERSCLDHAGSIVSILSWLNQESARPCFLEFDATICAYHATRILLFISEFGMSKRNKPSKEFAVSRLELCLAALRRFFPRSKLVGPVIAEMEKHIKKLDTTPSTPIPTAGDASADLANSTAPSSMSQAPSQMRRHSEHANDCEYERSRETIRSINGHMSLSRNDVDSSATTEASHMLAVHSLLRMARFVDREETEVTTDQQDADAGRFELIPISTPAGNATSLPPRVQQYLGKDKIQNSRWAYEPDPIGRQPQAPLPGTVAPTLFDQIDLTRANFAATSPDTMQGDDGISCNDEPPVWPDVPPTGVFASPAAMMNTAAINSLNLGTGREWEFSSFVPMQAWDMQNAFCSWLDEPGVESWQPIQE